jgi:hypothetical protein
MGSADQRITLTNVATTPCSLSGQPAAFDDHTSTGSAVVVAVAPHGGYGRGLDAVANLAPGEKGFTDVEVSDQCPGFQQRLHITSFALRLEDGTHVPVADGGGLAAPPPRCAVSASAFGTPHVPGPQPSYPVDPLKVALHLPASVRTGTTFDFTVTLSNPTSAAVPLQPCPTYEEIWKPESSAPALTRAYRLNCSGQPEVAAHQSLTFQMRMVAPTRALPDWLSWRLESSQGVGGGAMVTVTS